MNIEPAGFFLGPNIYLPVGGLKVAVYADNLETTQTSAYPDACENLMQQLPGLAQHRGGKMQAEMQAGLPLRDLLVHVIMELPRSLGEPMPKVRLLNDGAGGVLELFVSGFDEAVTTYLLKTAGSLLADMEEADDFGMTIVSLEEDDLEENFQRFRQLVESSATRDVRYLMAAAQKRGIPAYRLIDSLRFLQFGQGSKRKLLMDSVSNDDPAITYSDFTLRSRQLAILGNAGIPVPEFRVVATHAEGLVAATELGYPVTIKEETNNYLQGKTSTQLSMPVNDAAQFESILQANIPEGMAITVETLNQGNRFMCLLLNGEPEITLQVAPGSPPRDVTKEIHADNLRLLRRIGRLAPVALLGVELIGDYIAESWKEQNLVTHYLHFNPGLHGYVQVAAGERLPGKLLDRMFPQKQDGRIPTISCVGDDNRSVRVALAQLLRALGHQFGEASADGFLVPGDDKHFTAANSATAAQNIFRDPAVECAVVDYTPQQIIDAGVHCYRLGVVWPRQINSPDLPETHKQALDVAVGCADKLVLSIDDLAAMETVSIGDPRLCLVGEAGDPAMERHIEAGGQAVLVGGDQSRLQCSLQGFPGYADAGELPGLVIPAGMDREMIAGCVACLALLGLAMTGLEEVLGARADIIVH